MSRALPSLALTALLALGSLLALGCSGPQKVLGGDGATCEVPADCEEGFTCKASKCTPHRSRVGEVCVTDKGCKESLMCLSGRCSAGKSTAEDKARACAHIRGLVEAATRFQEAQTKERTPEAELALQLDAFAEECRSRLEEQDVSVETIACFEQSKTVPEVSACR